MEQLLSILNEIKPGVDFKVAEDLIENKVLDSIEIMELADEIMDTYEIDLTPMDIVPDNFKSVFSIYAMIQEKIENR